MDTSIIYDILGIGIGPFNLGLAAMLYDLPELKTLFVEQNERFNWHPGLLLPSARMQVPYYADLVSIVNPQSPFTYINFLRKTGRMFRFANHDNTFPLRVEYNRYCQWVASQFPNLRFGQPCTDITWEASTQVYTVHTMTERFQAKHIVLGTGTVPCLPACLTAMGKKQVIHAADYLFHKTALLQSKQIAIIGSGQSAAEIFNDLLPYTDAMESLSWFTRSNRLHPMDYSRFATELTSMDYIDHFYHLDDAVKKRVLEDQHYLYKGINHALIAQINDALYIREANGAHDNVHIQPNADLMNASRGGESMSLHFKHRETHGHFKHTTRAVIAATGYEYKIPIFLESIKDQIQWSSNGLFQVNKNYSIDRVNTLFVQNADLHTHGFNSADLGMGPYRNGVILNAVLQRDEFRFERDTTFQCFGSPG